MIDQFQRLRGQPEKKMSVATLVAILLVLLLTRNFDSLLFVEIKELISTSPWQPSTSP
jgi:hypothetical protein